MLAADDAPLPSVLVPGSAVMLSPGGPSAHAREDASTCALVDVCVIVELVLVLDRHDGDGDAVHIRGPRPRG